MASSSSSNVALQSFNLANDIKDISPQDEIFYHDADATRVLMNEEPWKKDNHYFTSCKISAVALIKMVIHARSGVPHEIMGLMQGKVVGKSLIIMDSYALPVQGTETRVNAGNEAMEYMVQYKDVSDKIGRLDHVIGWYHSHPGYGCWLSGIDVSTQMTNQKYQDPFVAVVIDPNRTISAGRVDIGAFRTYPEGYTPPDAAANEYQSIPLSKIEDFGVHANQYYPLEVQVFKSSLDTELLGLLWNKYWVNTLSQSPLISNRAYAASQLQDLHQKLRKAASNVPGTKPIIPSLSQEKPSQQSKDQKKEDNQLDKAVKDGSKIAIEAQHGLISQVIKNIIFSRHSSQASSSSIEDVIDTAMAVG